MKTVATAKGQIVIPAKLRWKYHIKAGTRILIYEGKEGIILKPVTREFYQKMRGSLKGANALKLLSEERMRDRQREEGSD